MAIRPNHVCANCGAAFRPVRTKQKYCSENCKRRAWDKRQIIRTLIEALTRLIDELQEDGQL